MPVVKTLAQLIAYFTLKIKTRRTYQIKFIVFDSEEINKK